MKNETAIKVPAKYSPFISSIKQQDGVYLITAKPLHFFVSADGTKQNVIKVANQQAALKAIRTVNQGDSSRKNFLSNLLESQGLQLGCYSEQIESIGAKEYGDIVSHVENGFTATLRYSKYFIELEQVDDEFDITYKAGSFEGYYGEEV